VLSKNFSQSEFRGVREGLSSTNFLKDSFSFLAGERAKLENVKAPARSGERRVNVVYVWQIGGENDLLAERRNKPI
jgi:hypothetical protein